MGDSEQKKIFFPILWTVMLLCIGYPLSFFLSWFWILLLPFELLFDFVREANMFLFRLVMWPRVLAKAIIDGSDKFPSPFPRETTQPNPVDPLGLEGQIREKQLTTPYHGYQG